MKILERIALIIFSIIILILSIISCLVVFDLVELSKISNYLDETIQNEVVARTIVVSSVICILLAIKALFFPSKIKKKEEIKSGILLENKDGRLLISKDTIENLINGVVKSFKDAKETQTKVFLDVDNNITVFISLLVNENAVIKELSSNIQTKIKETVKRNTDLDVSQININIKNLENIENKKIESNTAVQQTNVEKIKVENIKINNNENVNDESNDIQNEQQKTNENIIEEDKIVL